jgi:hypothetical protein
MLQISYFNNYSFKKNRNFISRHLALIAVEIQLQKIILFFCLKERPAEAPFRELKTNYFCCWIVMKSEKKL